MKENRFRLSGTEIRRLVRAGTQGGKRLVPERDLRTRKVSSGSREAPLQAMGLLEPERVRLSPAEKQGGTAS